MEMRLIMKKRPLLMLALMGMAMPLPRAWSIDAACVEGTAKCQCPDGHWVPVSCSQDCSPALCGIGGGSGSGGGEGGGGLTPIQNMQFQAALGTEQALVTGFVQWLLSPDPNAGKMKQQKLQEQRQAEELERQRIAEERRQRELARIRFQNQNNQLLAKLKDNAPDQKLKLKDPDIEQTLTSLKNQARTIDCATSEIYDTADTLGEQGAQFSSGMSQQTLQAMKNLAQLPSDGSWARFFMACNVCWLIPLENCAPCSPSVSAVS